MSEPLVLSYEGRICRAPIERGAYTLPTSVGCPYNACRFCMLFKHLKYREIAIEEIAADIARVAALSGSPRTIYLGDGGAFAQSTDRLAEIISLLRKNFPRFEAIHMDATVTSVLSKNDSELARLRSLAPIRLYIGIESGLDDVLALMKKDHTVSQAYEAASRLADADISFDAHIMTGIAGRGRGMENAEATGRFIVESGASRVVNFSMFVSRRSPLFKDAASGAITFSPASELENMREARRLIEIIQSCGRRMLFDSCFDRTEFRVRGYLPDEGERMIANVDRVIAKLSNEPETFAVTEEYPGHDDLCCAE